MRWGAGVVVFGLAVAGLAFGALVDAAAGQTRLKIGIIGAGQIGGTLGEHCGSAGDIGDSSRMRRRPESVTVAGQSDDAAPSLP